MQDEKKEKIEDENAVILGGKKITGKKAVVIGSVLGVAVGLIVVAVLAFIIL